MLQVFTSIILLSVIFPLIVWAGPNKPPKGRQVDTIEDEIRLGAWGEYIKEKKEFERRRLEGAREIKQEKKEEAINRDKFVAEYKLEKQKQTSMMNDSGAEYKKNAEDRLRWAWQLEQERKSYVEEREKNKLRKFITLTEEEEFDLIPEPERVPFKNRKLFSTTGAGAGSSAGAAARNDNYTPPPPPPLNWEAPPPPPPPPEFYESDVPPPPPDGFDGGVPPPIFDDEPAGY